MLKQLFFLIYEMTQLVLFFILNVASYIIRKKKLRLFLKLRSPRNFYRIVNSAHENYKKLTVQSKGVPIYWFHVSSAGEMEQAIPVARKLHDKLGVYFFVTYYSFSAEPFLKNFPAAIGFAGLPLDIRFVYYKLMKIIPITKIFFVRYDIWPSLLFACKQKKLDINLISATKIKTKKGFRAYLSEKWNTLFYKYFSYIFAVSVEDLKYFKNLIPDGQVYLAGDAKWVRANERAQSLVKTKSDPVFFNFIEFFKRIKNLKNKKILVIGSPHSEEHELVLKISALKEKFCIIYVPHDVEAKLVQSLLLNLNNTGYNSVLYSDLAPKINGHDEDMDLYKYDLVVIDKTGFLAEIYQVADVAVIGGGFDGQIHNVLEAVAHGVPTLFGSSYSRAREASELMQANAALSFESINNMFHFLSTWVNFKKEQAGDSALSPETSLANASLNARRLFQNLPDTSEVIFDVLNKKI